MIRKGIYKAIYEEGTWHLYDDTIAHEISSWFKFATLHDLLPASEWFYYTIQSPSFRPRKMTDADSAANADSSMDSDLAIDADSAIDVDSAVQCHPKPFPFLHLPAELRLMVYLQTIETNETVDISRHDTWVDSHGDEWGDFWPCPVPSNRAWHTPFNGLFLANRQIYYELMGEYYMRNTFIVRTSRKALWFSAHAPKIALQNIRTLHLPCILENEWRENWREYSQLVDACPSLEELKIEVYIDDLFHEEFVERMNSKRDCDCNGQAYDCNVQDYDCNVQDYRELNKHTYIKKWDIHRLLRNCRNLKAFHMDLWVTISKDEQYVKAARNVWGNLMASAKRKVPHAAVCGQLLNFYNDGCLLYPNQEKAVKLRSLTL